MAASASRSPRICFVGLQNLPLLTRDYGAGHTGGAELQQTLLARALSDRGWSVSMIVADHGQPDGAAWDGIRTFRAYRPDAGIPVVRFLHPRWTKVVSAMERADAQIYYTSCAGALLAQVVLFAHRRGQKAVFRVASDSDCDPRQLLVQFRRDRLLYRYGLARADLVLAQTARQQQALQANFGRSSRVAPSLPVRAGRSRDFAERDIDVLWVGNIREPKRPDLLLELARRLPETRFEVIGGPMPGAERLYEKVRLDASQLPNVTFHGPLPFDEVRAYYERARILVSTSRIEGFPNTYLQAWTHGTPVVAFLDPDGVLERLRLGRAVQGIEEMCAALTQLRSDRAQWEAASARARDYMERDFGEDKVLAPYLAALEGLRRAEAHAPLAMNHPGAME